MSSIRRHLSYANVMATLAVFIALGGTALASVIITNNSQVASGTISGHHPPSGKHANIIGGSINGQDVQHLQWQTLTLKSGWAGNCNLDGSPAIAKSVEGVVYLRGEVCRTSGSSISPFDVPAGFAPTKSVFVPVGESGGTVGKLQINSSGQASVVDDADHPGIGASLTQLFGASYTRPF